MAPNPLTSYHSTFKIGVMLRLQLYMHSYNFEPINFTRKYVAVKNVVRNFSKPLTTRHYEL